MAARLRRHGRGRAAGGSPGSGWRDSGDTIRYADGGYSQPPIALCEVQGYAYQAAVHGAGLLEAFGEPGAQWRAWASRLATAFRQSYWVHDHADPYPALALDRDNNTVDSLCSSIGHLLGTGLLSQAEEEHVAQRLAGDDMDSGYGLRTMSAANAAYSPQHYHNGSVWPHDTAIAIVGLARSGHTAAAAALADGLLEAAAGFGWRLPEVFSGEPRSSTPRPLPYASSCHSSCHSQAWAAAAAGALAQALDYM